MLIGFIAFLLYTFADICTYMYICTYKYSAVMVNAAATTEQYVALEYLEWSGFCCFRWYHHSAIHILRVCIYFYTIECFRVSYLLLPTFKNLIQIESETLKVNHSLSFSCQQPWGNLDGHTTHRNLKPRSNLTFGYSISLFIHCRCKLVNFLPMYTYVYIHLYTCMQATQSKLVHV